MDIKLILDAINDLKSQLDTVLKRQANPVRPSRSEDLKDLFGALAKAQAEMKTAGLNAENPYFKSAYADLAEIVRVSRPALSKNGLTVIQQIMPNDDGQNILHCILAHSSGQWIETRMRILPSKPDVQSLASYITYLRRYSYAAIVGVVSANEDDDGEVAVHDSRETEEKGVQLNTRYDPRNKSYETIGKDQLEELEYELEEYPDICEKVLDSLKIQNLSDMPKSKFLAATKRIREIKHLRNNSK